MAHDLVTELLQYSSLACFMAIWQLCANLLIPNCLRSNLSYSPLAALELYVNVIKALCYIDNNKGLCSHYLHVFKSKAILYGYRNKDKYLKFIIINI